MTKEQDLAMRLPYNVKVNLFENGVLFGIPTIFNSECFMVEFELKSAYSHKPILHPLTDLTKEIEHNGEKFVPIIILGWSENIIGWSKKNINLAIENMRFDDAIKLIEWHFDIAGLIEKGEAIDVNTLPETPYK